MTKLTRGAFAFPGTTLAYKTGGWREQIPSHRPAVAPCHHACPAGENPQAWLALAEQGNFEAAWRAIVADNPMPSVTGRVCPHPCETGCNRGQYDEPLAIHGIERFLGDESHRQGWQFDLPQLASDAPDIAVVGAGPAGMSAAYHLRRLGYRVTVLEQLAQAGGILRTSLPAYRLPKDVLDAECERLFGNGIELRTRQKLGKDMSLTELRQDYSAVFLGPGAQKARSWSIGGAVPSDLHDGVHLLEQWVEFGAVPAMKSAAVIGGGNTAVDVARVLRRAGVEVHLITHRELPPGEDCMPANPREVAQAIEEGVEIHPHHGVTRLILRGERAVGVEMVHMKKLPGEDGRLHRIPFEGTETILHVDQVIPAVGQEVDGSGFGELLAGHALFEADVWGLSRLAGVYVGGDAKGGEGTVAAAVGDGHRSARAIHAALQGTTLADAVAEPIPVSQLNLNYFEPSQRAVIPVLEIAERIGDAEVEGAIGANEARTESRRCFSCGQCMACDNCWTLCPDNAVLKTGQVLEDGSFYVFDYDYCKGCGICAHECPCGFIAMSTEE